MKNDRYGRDVLADGARGRARAAVPEIEAELGMVVEDAAGEFCGAVVGCEKNEVTLEDRFGRRRVFPLGRAAFLVEGKPATLVRPAAPARSAVAGRTASGSIAVEGAKARVARQSRIYVEGLHDAELVERVWGDDLRVEGVVVEYLEGVDHLPEICREFRPDPTRRLGVLVDHLVDGSKENRIAERVSADWPGAVLVTGHPFVDVWQAVKPSVLGIDAWPQVPRGVPWKEGVLAALGWDMPTPAAWKAILGRVRSFADLEPALLGRVEELIDFVTAPGG